MLTQYEIHLESAMSSLKAARDVLNARISEYPTPIAGCDEQFNRMLSDRTRISRSIASLSEQPFVSTPRVLYPGASVEVR